MPSGITSDLYDGKDVDLRDYLMIVGRQFGFAILQRDEPLSEPVRIPDESRSLNYHEKGLFDALDRAVEVYSWSPEEAEVASQEAFRQETIQHLERKRDEFILWLRYEAMKARVQFGWDPPERLAHIKEAAVEYLNDSQKFDCRNPTVKEEPQMLGRFGWGRPQLLTGEAYRDKELAAARHDIEYHLRYGGEDREHEADRRDWIEEFLGSLPHD